MEAPDIDLDALWNDFKGGGSWTIEWGNRIHRERMKIRLSQSHLARMCGTSRQTIAKYERGEIAPREHMKYALCSALNLRIHELFPTPSVEEVRTNYPNVEVAA